MSEHQKQENIADNKRQMERLHELKQQIVDQQHEIQRLADRILLELSRASAHKP